MASLAMLGAALLQVYIYRQSPCGYHAATCGSDADGNPIVADINVWLQVPVYFFIALSEVLASITSLEYVPLGPIGSRDLVVEISECRYAYTKAPKSMRGTIQSIFLLTTAIANAITEAFVRPPSDRSTKPADAQATRAGSLDFGSSRDLE